MEQQSFDFNQAEIYMRKTFVFEKRREALNEEVNATRKWARDLGVPTKAVEAAVRVTRKRLAALALVNQEEFDELCRIAEELQEMDDDVEALTQQSNVRMWSGGIDDDPQKQAAD